jgi:hypothetical protein
MQNSFSGHMSAALFETCILNNKKKRKKIKSCNLSTFHWTFFVIPEEQLKEQRAHVP